MFKNRKKRNIFIAVTSVLLVAVVFFVSCALYVGDYYRTDISAVQAFMPEGAHWKEQSDGIIVFEPENVAAGFIFYPGGKVEYTAYIPLMQSLSEKGILCVLVEMPFNLAVLDINAADGIQKDYPQINDWYIGGHSLGGSMAASYLSGHTDEYSGLVLLGSYSTANISESGLNVLSVYGSEDTVMNCEKYQENKSNLPNNFTEIIIEGGNHAGFGMYGAQEGDGASAISNTQQINITADAISKIIVKE